MPAFRFGRDGRQRLLCRFAIGCSGWIVCQEESDFLSLQPVGLDKSVREETFPPRLVVALQQLLEELLHFAFAAAFTHDADARLRWCKSLLAVRPVVKYAPLGGVQRRLVEGSVEHVQSLWCLMNFRKARSRLLKVWKHRGFESGK